MPSDAAKNARTFLMKYCSFVDKLSQSFVSCDRSISSAVQKDASCFLYISQTAGYCIGNITHRFGLSMSSGSDFSSSEYSLDTLLRIDVVTMPAGASELYPEFVPSNGIGCYRQF